MLKVNKPKKTHQGCGEKVDLFRCHQTGGAERNNMTIDQNIDGI